MERGEDADTLQKPVAHRKAFEIYGDAATEVEQRVAVLRSRVEPAPRDAAAAAGPD